MPAWILDDGPFGDLARFVAVRDMATWPQGQSIAWALSERTDGIFVVVDRRATILALAELGCGRVAHAHDLWLHLRGAGLINRAQFDKLCQATCAKDQSTMPLRCQ